MNVIPTEGRNLYLPPVWERFLAALEMTKNLNCYLTPNSGGDLNFYLVKIILSAILII